MDKIMIVLVYLFGFLIFAGTAVSSEWYIGGTLHRSNTKEWMNSDYNNRLATSADWFTSLTKKYNSSLQNKLKRLPQEEYLSTLKIYSVQLEKCVSHTAHQRSSGFLISSVASACYITEFGISSEQPDSAKKPTIDYKRAIQIVKNLNSNKNCTVDKLLNDKANIPVVEDLGWKAYPLDDGFEIERLMLLNGTMELSYRWTVNAYGHATPENGKAIGITK